MNRTAVTALVLLALIGATARADETPTRRSEDGEEGGSRRDGPDDGSRAGRRGPEGSPGMSDEEKRQKAQQKLITLITPPLCGTSTPGAFRDKLLGLRNPDDLFTVEVWGDRREYYVQDSIFYFLRSNRTAYVTLFWIGPEGSVFIPFVNMKVEANRDHKIDPRNIIVEPVGLERWRVIATLEPHQLPCQGTGDQFVRAIENIQRRGLWSTAQWDVQSHSGYRGSRLYRRRIH